MKQLLVLLAILGLSANAMADMKWGGSAWIGYTSMNNTDGNSDAGDNDQDFTQWFDLHATVAKGDSLSAYIKVRHINFWGETDNFGDDVTMTADKKSWNRGNGLHVLESWAWWKVNDAWSLKFGRFNLELNDGELVSVNAWNDVPKGFDGAAAVGEYEWGRLGFVGVRNGDYDAGDAAAITPDHSDGSIVFWGGMFDLKNLPDALSRVNFHYVTAQASEASGATPSIPKVDKNWMGLGLKGEKSKLDYRFAYVNYSGTSTSSGTETDLGGSMMDFELGYNLGFKNSRVALYYHTDSGNDTNAANGLEAYDSFHYKKHENAGRMDLVEWGKGKASNTAATSTGLTETAVKFSMDVKDSSTFDVSYHMFSESEDTNNDGEESLGTEIDLGYQHNYDNGFYTRVEIGQFSFGDGYGANMDDAATRLYVEGGFDF